MATTGTFPLSRRHLYRLSLAAAIFSTAAVIILITLDWAVLSGILYLPVQTFCCLAVVIILTSGMVYLLLRIALSYRSLTTCLRTAKKIQERGTMIVPASVPDSSCNVRKRNL